MRSLTLSAVARALSAALILTVLAVGAHAQNAAGPSSGHGPGSGPAGRAAILPGGVVSDACGVLELPAPSQFGDPANEIKGLSQATQQFIRQCRCDTQQCVADALDQYAAALAVVTPRLPQRLQEIPYVVADAARRVRSAPTKAAAIQVLREAIAVIHKDVSLVRAEDPSSAQRETRSGDFVAATLNVASLSLERAGGL